MQSGDVTEILEKLELEGIDVWLNGGWGVDALLGHQTREHQDLDITIASSDGPAYTELMSVAGFEVARVDNEFNWVMVDAKGRRVDVHLVDFSAETLDDQGKAMYGPQGLPFEVGSLDGHGTIDGRSVRCETPESQVRGHAGYDLDEEDYRDVAALCHRFGIPVPSSYPHRPRRVDERTDTA